MKKAFDKRKKSSLYDRRLKDSPYKVSEHQYLHNRSAALKANGWTMELVDIRFEEQSSLCALCDKKLHRERRRDKEQAHADHKHCIPPIPRGILCISCNLAVGRVEYVLRMGRIVPEEGTWLARAIKYLLSYE
jgi:hypothetical protein